MTPTPIPMSVERPILFSGEMVRAILDGRKTVTRRVVRDVGLYAIDPKFHGVETAARERENLLTRCPYGSPGGKLWVRETWKYAHGKLSDGRAELCTEKNCNGILYAEDFASAHLEKQWRPSIFMPRWASRITLEVVSVRVEKLSEITAAEIQAEGFRVDERSVKDGGVALLEQFARLWDKLNKKRGHGWETNPWVWRIELRRVG